MITCNLLAFAIAVVFVYWAINQYLLARGLMDYRKSRASHSVSFVLSTALTILFYFRLYYCCNEQTAGKWIVEWILGVISLCMCSYHLISALTAKEKDDPQKDIMK